MTGREPAAARWELEIGGLRLPLEATLEIGRDPSCAVPLDDERVSWRHLRLSPQDGHVELLDLGSKNGTFANGRQMDSGPTYAKGDTLLQLGSTRARLRRIVLPAGEEQGGFRRIPIRGRTLRIGRAPDNDVCLEEPNVSWYHAEVHSGSPPTIVDLGSRNGVRLGNQMLRGSGPLQPGILAGIGPFGLRVEQGELIVTDQRGGLNLSARGVSVSVGGDAILQPTSLSVAPGEFVALIGASGSGKTTLLKCLAGVAEPSSGEVMMGSDPLELRLTEVGYVPQSDVVHDRLTVREALLYAAKLRLPSDTRHEEHAAAVEDVLAELRLTDHQDTLIGRLSGGQRKRVACGVELIGKPTMLLLDEPTSGLDPPLERRLMRTFRGLADSGRGLVVVTHATSSLALCDTVAVMVEGGHLVFTGSPSESLEHFQVAAYDEIYNASDLLIVPPISTEPPASRRQKKRTRLLSGRSLVKQTAALTSRYARTFTRDRRTLATLLGQAPVMGLLICTLYPLHLLALPDRHPTKSAQFIFLLVTAALWLGLIDSCREIVKERSLILRELAVGVRLDALLLAKACILFALTMIQCVLLVAVATAIEPLHADFDTYLSLTVVLVLTSWSMVGVGLVVSTLARSVDQATSVIPLLLIPQLLFGGVLVAYAQFGAVIKAVSDLTISRWAFAGAGHVIQMNARLADAPQVAAVSGYGTNFFDLSLGITAVILLGFTAATLLMAAILLAGRVHAN